MSAKSPREQMIETAARRFQRDGYHATSWRALVEAAGTPWGSAHHYFPGGKEQLGVAAIELGGAAVQTALTALFAQHERPHAAVRAWCTGAATALERGGYREGCPVATVALETAPGSAALGAACRAALEAWTALLASHLARAGVKKRRAGELATLAVSAFEGALLLARVTRSTAPLELAGEHLAGLFKSEGA